MRLLYVLKVRQCTPAAALLSLTKLHIMHNCFPVYLNVWICIAGCYRHMLINSVDGMHTTLQK